MSPRTLQQVKKHKVKNLSHYRKIAAKADEAERELTIRRHLQMMFARTPHLRKFAPPTGLSKSDARADLLLEREILRQVARKSENGGYLVLTPEGHRPVPPRTSRLLSRSKRSGAQATLSRKATGWITENIDETGKSFTHLHTRDWCQTSEITKVLAYVESIPQARRAAFTLNLSEKVYQDALASKRGFAKYVQDRIARELRLAFSGLDPVDFMFVVDGACEAYTPVELIKLHIHGVVSLPGIVTPGRSNWDTLRAVLHKAGGKVSGAAKARQVDTRWCYNVPGWVTYMYEHRLISAQAIKSARVMAGLPKLPITEHVLAATVGLRKNGQLWFRQARASREPTPVGRRRKSSRKLTSR